ncbi:MAG TPA: glucoamylase family protein [Opitutaceae bacterium]|nr:glucoamylase family protein [Opitutaceae bacterium]
MFTSEHLADHARRLASGHRTAQTRATNRLLHRLNRNEQILRAYNRATHAVDQVRRVTHAAEWLLDNFYLIEEQIQMARRHLPQGYSRELPRLVDGASAGLPRVYDLALELISHVDAQVDEESLATFISAYQETAPLTLGELWAIPIMLRLALIENLRRVTARLTIARRDRDLADHWVKRLEDVAGESNPSRLVLVVAAMAGSEPPLSTPFVAEFYQRISRQNPSMQIARNWLEQRLAEEGLSAEQLIIAESQSQAADQVTISHSITSLRFLSAVDWRQFVERVSLVEQTLRRDPAGVHAAMDFATRDHYRHSVEAIARHSGQPERAVAEQAIALAAEAARTRGAGDRTAHVGFYLVDKGRPELERIAGVSWPWRTRFEQLIQRFPLAFYVGGIAVLTAGFTWALLEQTRELGVHGASLWLLAGLFLVCTSQFAVGILNWFALLVMSPHLLPRLDCSDGIGPDRRTMVAVPTLLTGPAAVEHLLETLEIHHLANRDEHLHFALLTDFPDAGQAVMPGDAALLDEVRAGVAALNRKYASQRKDIFFLFHRPRRWNEREGRWMGYERKRGKLAEFNAILRGGSLAPFSATEGDLSVLPAVKYVITLDTDTQLPRDAAHRLVGAIAHPLNRPQFDPERGIVTEGYGILQPRVGVSLPSAGRSWFVRLFAGDVGIDPYTRAVSDVYQDVFQEGSFIGKGIYDVDAFERALAGRFPENAVLSHDLIESCHARSALISDVELYEEYPSRYNVDSSRRHRWIRGDWQIAQWLLPRVPGSDARQIDNPLSGLSRWKILDNLRRSLVPAALLSLLFAGWVWRPELAEVGLLLVLAILFVPPLLGLCTDLARRPEDRPLALHLASALRAGARQLGQILLTLAFLPYDTFVSLDAIGRTLLRVLLTHRRLLEWQTASEAERTARMRLVDFYATMWIAPALAVAGTLLLRVPHPGEVPSAALVFGLWASAPWIAWRISQPIVPSPVNLTPPQLKFLRHIARVTWRYFETFVTEADHWLPPDNFQEQPVPIVASRTSPTNLGLALLSSLAASDFGYLPVGGLLQRTRQTLSAMAGLERHRGHFYNWYDTRTLKPLLPLYVSSVDSGNLAGHLLTLTQGLAELPDRPLLPPRLAAGLADTAAALGKVAGKNFALRQIEAALGAEPADLRAALALLERVGAQARELAAALPADAGDELKGWTRALVQDCQAQREDLVLLAPWLVLPPAPADQPAEIAAGLDRIGREATLRDLAELGEEFIPLVARLRAAASGPRQTHLGELLAALQRGAERAAARIADTADLARQATALADMDFHFLFNEARDLFAVGYNVSERRLDSSCYDLLASEARLGSFVAIAQGQVPQDHWFSLGRQLVTAHGRPILVSWSGSMFEYLMPLLVMPSYEHTLLDETCRGAVDQQIEYARMRHVPWGMSESGYNLTDVHLNYQYRAFGVPGLGLKRGLGENLVVAPYATLMALMVRPRAACENLERLAAGGRTGPYGFYEAVDYTPSRLPPGQSSVTIRSFMVHHQGMGLLAVANALLDRPMQRRFLSCPIFKAADLLLQERVPAVTARVLSEHLELGESRKLAGQREDDGLMRISTNPAAEAPQVHLLSNGRYHVVINATGGGYSRWREVAVTRWREDPTADAWGTFIYLRDIDSGECWSAAHQPVGRTLKRCESIFTQARAEFRVQQEDLEVHTEICVSPEDDIELRRITVANHGHRTRTLELTTYAEVVLAPPAADAAHPAFSNLFVQTERLAADQGVLCTRRARSEEEHPPWLLHVLAGTAAEGDAVSCETDRARFLGRGRTPANPAALDQAGPLSNTTGPVLDPIVALRRVVAVPAGEKVRVDVVLGMTEKREDALALVAKYRNPRMADRAFDLAWTHSQVILRQLNATEAEAQLFGRLAGPLLYAHPAWRAEAGVLLANRRGQSGLWSYGISGDAPIVLLRISHPERMDLVRQLVQAHSYWRMKGLAVELVILNEDNSVYHQPLHDQIVTLVTSGIEAQLLDKAGGIFVRRVEQVPAEDRLLLQAVARIVLIDENGSLADQLGRREAPAPAIPMLVPVRTPPRGAPPPLPARELANANGLGGFTPDGREYVITLPPGQATPAPWVNVIANPHFGTVVSESGSAYSWAENCHEFRLTPWANDPVVDPTGEAFYLRDEQTGQFWSPTPLPAPGAAPYVIRHGFGYTVFEHTENGVASELWIYVAMDAPVKFAVLKVRNVSGQLLRLSATGYWEWVLGDLRARNLPHVQTELDAKTGALLVRNPYNTDFAGRIAYVDVGEAAHTATGDRREFLGRNGSLARPAALRRSRLSGRAGTGLDPCGAMQVPFALAPGQEREIVFQLGVGRGAEDVQAQLRRFRRPGAARQALEAVWAYWGRTLGAVHVETPDPAVNAMANGWLLYQTLACRLWARTGFYQSGGAFGFRDQLQDTMALVHAEPALTREHLLRAAGRQFREGDVQHWWHPPTGRGVRTHFSDDYLWLPYATCRYVAALADTGVLDEQIPFLEGRPLKPEEESCYELPTRSVDSGTLYEHCVRAIEHGLRFGAHGLPLIGCGDWNDGMNLIGRGGRGESVWLAFFLYDVLIKFAALARSRQDTAFSERCLAQAGSLRANLERNAWDGEWYRRAYFDNGDPLGSQSNPECQIDSLPQSWAVLSGAGEPARARQAMEAVRRRLVRTETGIIQLFDPPFDRSPLNPGYIKGYIPGVRENGGQYTHAAVWTAMAFAQLGDTAQAWQLFSLLNPVHHGNDPARMRTYRVEPYVVAADIYAVPPHTGRGGWTWYTGSAGWMYRLLVESLLGLRLEGARLHLQPRLPAEWPGFTAHYRYRDTVYHIFVTRSADGAGGLRLDGQPLPGTELPLEDDRREHRAELGLTADGREPARRPAPAAEPGEAPLQPA